MSKFGVNVPPGIPVFKVDDVLTAAQKMASEDGEVSSNLNTCDCTGVSVVYCASSGLLGAWHLIVCTQHARHVHQVRWTKQKLGIPDRR